MAKMKECKDCKAEIPKKAKKCSHCRSKQPQGVGLGGVVVLGLFTMLVWNWASNSADKEIAQRSAPPLTAAQIAENKAQQKASAEKSRAFEDCLTALRNVAKFPSSVDFSGWDSKQNPMKGGGWIVRIDMEAKNGYGNIVPQLGYCEWKGNRVVTANMSAR